MTRMIAKKHKQMNLFVEKKSGPGNRPGTKSYLIHQLKSYGGAINHRKYKRPFDSRKAVHLILRSRWLSGSRSLIKGNRRQWVEKILKTTNFFDFFENQ